MNISVANGGLQMQLTDKQTAKVGISLSCQMLLPLKEMTIFFFRISDTKIFKIS